MTVKNNLNSLWSALRPGCRLVAVGKTQPVARIQEAYDAGQRLFGENRVQELREKQAQLPADIEWHLIGHLQTNKVKYIAPWIGLIHSIDSLDLLAEVSRQGAKAHRVVPCLLQVHIAREETKFGFLPSEVVPAIRQITPDAFPFVQVKGLMGMATLTDNQSLIREEFRGLHGLFQDIASLPLPETVTMTELSMGMSSDYRIAMDEGSTLVRIGTAIFGERNR
jgi:hypothetical protein